VRAALVVAIATVSLLGACGGGGDSNPSTTSSGNPNGTTGTSAKEPGDHSGKTQGTRKKGSKGDGRAHNGRKAQGGSFQGSGNVFFYKGRSRCITLPVALLASIYQARSDNPKDVARAYANREAPSAAYRRASIAGCLAGIESRGKR
jgi:hypothetical protein